MGKNDFNKGMEAGARPFEEKFEKMSQETRAIGEKVNEKLDTLGTVMDAVIDDLSDMQKKELYHLNTPYDLKEDLDDDEKEILAALLMKLSEIAENNEYQKQFIRSVNAYIGITVPQTGLDVSCIENIENINSQKILLQTAMEYMYLEIQDFCFLDDYEEIFEHFSVNRKGIREIENHIETVYRAVGEKGIAEKYGFVPEEKTEGLDEETVKLYQETTPYDLLTDLSEKDTEALCSLLERMEQVVGKGEEQKAFLEVLKEQGELDFDKKHIQQGEGSEIETLDSQKIILQVLMEYGFLGSGEFEFLEDELFDDFAVSRKEIRQIKERIERVYKVKGSKGIIDKYQYMEKAEDSHVKLEISALCADKVNAHEYIELDEYVVYRDEIDGDDILYKVHKQTGERKVLWRGERGAEFFFAGNQGSKILLHRKDYEDYNEILTMRFSGQASSKKLEVWEIDVAKDSKRKLLLAYDFSRFPRIEYIKGHLIYKANLDNRDRLGEDILIDFDSSSEKSTVICDPKGKMFIGHMLWFVPDKNGNIWIGTDSNAIYRYNLRNSQTECLQLDESIPGNVISCDSKIFLDDGKIILSARSSSGVQASVIDLKALTVENRKKDFYGNVHTELVGKYTAIVPEEKKSDMRLYDLVEDKTITILKNTNGTKYYVSGRIFKEEGYWCTIKNIQIINDILYYNVDDIVYKTPLNECREVPEEIPDERL